MIDEDFDTFLEDHGKPCSIGAVDFLGILDQPDVSLPTGGFHTKSTMYALTIQSTVVVALGIRNNTAITVAGAAYSVRDAEQLDDGAFTLLNISKT